MAGIVCTGSIASVLITREKSVPLILDSAD